MSGWDWYTLIFTVVVLVMITYALWTAFAYWQRYRWCKVCQRRGHKKWLFLGTHRTHRWYIHRRIKKARRINRRWDKTRRRRCNR